MINSIHLEILHVTMHQIITNFEKTYRNSTRPLIIVTRLQGNKTFWFGPCTKPGLRFCANQRGIPQEVESEPVEDASPTAFTSEPTTLDDLLERYHVENKMPGRDPGTALLLTHAQDRKGRTSEMQDNQRYKLFLVP